MKALLKLVRIETKLLLREPVSAFFALIFPALILIVLGSAIPAFREATEELGGLRLIDIYTPVMLAVAVATVAMVSLLNVLANYRERGVLRRLATTPVSPATLLGAQLVVYLGALAAGTALAYVVARVVFGVAAPANPVGVAVGFVLATAAMCALALCVASLTPNARASSGVGMLIYFPMLFFAGMWTPGPAMPGVARTIADFTPLGAASQAMQDAWAGAWPQALHLGVMAVVAAVLGALATRLFRWT